MTWFPRRSTKSVASSEWAAPEVERLSPAPRVISDLPAGVVSQGLVSARAFTPQGGAAWRPGRGLCSSSGVEPSRLASMHVRAVEVSTAACGAGRRAGIVEPLSRLDSCSAECQSGRVKGPPCSSQVQRRFVKMARRSLASGPLSASRLHLVRWAPATCFRLDGLLFRPVVWVPAD